MFGWLKNLRNRILEALRVWVLKGLSYVTKGLRQVWYFGKFIVTWLIGIFEYYFCLYILTPTIKFMSTMSTEQFKGQLIFNANSGLGSLSNGNINSQNFLSASIQVLMYFSQILNQYFPISLFFNLLAIYFVFFTLKSIKKIFI